MHNIGMTAEPHAHTQIEPSREWLYLKIAVALLVLGLVIYPNQTFLIFQKTALLWIVVAALVLWRIFGGRDFNPNHIIPAKLRSPIKTAGTVFDVIQQTVALLAIWFIALFVSAIAQVVWPILCAAVVTFLLAGSLVRQTFRKG